MAGKRNFLAGGEKAEYWGQDHLDSQSRFSCVIWLIFVGHHCRRAFWSDCTRVCVSNSGTLCGGGCFSFFSWSRYPRPSRRGASVPKRPLPPPGGSPRTSTAARKGPLPARSASKGA